MTRSRRSHVGSTPRVATLALTGLAALLPLACGSPGAGSERNGTRRDAVCDGVDSYIGENGEVVFCVYTEEPGPTDPCFLYPELCYPPDPPDPCELNPDSCSGSSGGEPPLPVCSTVDEIPPNFQAAVDQRVESCFETNWSTLPFNTATDATNYSPGSGGYFYSIGDWLANNLASCVIQNFDWVFYGGSVGGQTMQNMVNRLNQQAQEENLTPHQKICSAMCVSGKLITYSTSNMLNMLPSNAVSSGVGVCREFAEIGERLLDGMGFSSSTVGSGATQHAFVEVTSPEGGTFYVEPQTASCIFYNQH